jgi:hypothetical protein
MRRLSLAAAAAALSLCLIAPGTPLGAYATTGHKWGGTSVQYYVNPENLYVSAADAVASVQSAANAWNAQGGVDLKLVYAGTTNRNSLTLDYTNNVFFRNDSSGAIAEAYWWWDGTGKLVDADIVYHQNYKFYGSSSACNGDGYYIDSVGVHEFGHALGLNHSSVGSATMYPTANACDTSFMTLDADDISGLQSLYPKAATVTSAPTAPSNPRPADGSTGVATSVTLSWSSSNAQVYDLYLNGQLYASGLTSASRSVSGLAAGMPYTWSVVARNSVGSTGGPTWSFTTTTSTTTTTRKGGGKKR